MQFSYIKFAQTFKISQQEMHETKKRSNEDDVVSFKNNENGF